MSGRCVMMDAILDIHCTHCRFCMWIHVMKNLGFSKGKTRCLPGTHCVNTPWLSIHNIEQRTNIMLPAVFAIRRICVHVGGLLLEAQRIASSTMWLSRLYTVLILRAIIGGLSAAEAAACLRSGFALWLIIIMAFLQILAFLGGRANVSGRGLDEGVKHSNVLWGHTNIITQTHTYTFFLPVLSLNSGYGSLTKPVN